MSQTEQAGELLRSLGLNNLEADVYVFLLQSGEPVTAYRIGKALRRPTANVYKAIDALARKGAVVVDQGATRRCCPSPPEEFLGQLERNLLDKTRHATKVLSCLAPAPEDERIYYLESAPLVLERCRAMLARCEKIAVVDAFPLALKAVRPALRDALERGIELYVQTYEAFSLPGARIVQAHGSDEILAHWSSQQLNVVVDSQEVLLALMHEDLSDVHQAVWTSSLYLSCATHVGLMREHVFHRIAALEDRSGFPSEIKKLLDEQAYFHAATVPGQQRLFARFAAARRTP